MYFFILSVIDIFSRFLWLRPIENKDSEIIARALVDIYNVFGPPAILQSDQGPEFKGTVKLVCAALKVKIIYSSAYSPQTQGKDERSHRTWKEKIRFDISRCCQNEELNWVTSLPLYQKIYNDSPHRSLGMMSPFQVFFCRKSNRLCN